MRVGIYADSDWKVLNATRRTVDPVSFYYLNDWSFYEEFESGMIIIVSVIAKYCFLVRSKVSINFVNINSQIKNADAKLLKFVCSL